MRRKTVSLLLCLGVWLGLGDGWTWNQARPSEFRLESPSLVVLAAQIPNQAQGVNFLQNEAGIAAYVKVKEALNLVQIKDVFKTIETVSDEYVIGEIALANLPEEAHPHVYVNKDGWIVAYYSRHDPSSKILQWRGEGVATPNPLHEAILRISNSAEVEGINYYNFKYPNANKMMLITEAVENENNDYFHLTIPQGLRLLEASWSLYSSSGGGALDIDNSRIGNSQNRQVIYSDLNLRVGFRHTLIVREKGASAMVILLYQI